MKYEVCNANGKVLDEIDLDVLNAYTLGKAYNMPCGTIDSVDFSTSYDRRYDRNRYYSATFYYHLPNKILVIFRYNSLCEDKLTISYCFKKADGDVNMFTPPSTIVEVENVIYLSNMEEA